MKDKHVYLNKSSIKLEKVAAILFFLQKKRCSLRQKEEVCKEAVILGSELPEMYPEIFFLIKIERDEALLNCSARAMKRSTRRTGADELMDTKINNQGELCEMAENVLDEKALANAFIETEAIGQSMHPTIKSGDRIVIDRTKAGELKAGDVIAFSKDSFLICHRIQEVFEKDGWKYFMIRGDAYDKSDYFEVELHEIAGKVIEVIPPGKSLRLNNLLKKAHKGTLQCLGVFEAAKELYFKAVQSRLRLIFSIPRGEKTYPFQGFIDVPLKYVEAGDSEICQHPDSLGVFRIRALLGKNTCAGVEVLKSRGDKHRHDAWFLSPFWGTDVFCGAPARPR